MSDDPQAAYTQRLEARRAAAARHDARHRTLGNLRLAVAATAAVMAWLWVFRGALSGWWLGLPVCAFVALAMVHDGVLRRRALAERAAAYYERALGRLADQWAGHGQAGERFLDAAHPYAADLDIFGAGSLFE